MKYPQLVSPRAVNAISDWLVSRLEQLGVESPQIYTRLLLSLLQSSVQVNDPIEFSNLEAFFASRKGGHKRFHLPSDTETLKKLNAVQCLREIVSNEQETATIEQLVEELCEKLKDIERQTQNLDDEQQFLIETHLRNDSLLQAQINSQLHQQQTNSSSNANNNQHNSRHHYHNNNHQQHQLPPSTSSHHICNNSQNTSTLLPHNNHASAATATGIITAADAINDIDNDPKKRYFRAFPALSKEMEDSFRIWRRNAKSLTWPVVGRSIQVVENNNNNNSNSNSNINNSSNSVSLSSSSASSIISSSNIGGAGLRSISADKSFEKKLVNKVVSATTTSIHISDSGCGASVGDIQQQQQNQGAVGASAKKKSKRRRNQALSKGKNIQNVRKLSTAGNISNSSSAGGNKYHHYSQHHHRNTTSPAWDTDFKGCWEMGPDLIKEFLNRQNNNKRNRSNSDSMDQEGHVESKISTEMPLVEEHDDKQQNQQQQPEMMKRYIDLSFCYEEDDDDYDDDSQQQQQCIEVEGVDYVDEDYDDNTLTSISELAMDNINPRPLYQREGHWQKPLVFGGNVLMGIAEGGGCGDNALVDETTDSVDPIDFQQFKAKFNSSVEALWKDAAAELPTANINTQSTNLTQTVNSVGIGGVGAGGISSAFYATTSLNALAPFKKDLWNFWSNYNQQPQLGNKLATTASTSSMITTRFDDSSASSAAGADIANSSDYFSMPSNLDDFDKSVGGVRRANEAAAASLDAHTPSINVFLQNSIWSTSGDGVDGIGGGGGGGTSSTGDTDENFLIKVWHSNKKLSQLDVGHAISGEKMPSLSLATDNSSGGGEHDFIKSKETSNLMNNSSLGANLQFPPYQSLKWSEGINAGPPACNNSLRSHATTVSNSSSLRDDNNYVSFSSAANISGATWEAPAYGQSAQPDLKSWCASNPISLTEMYGSDVCDSIVNQPAQEDSEQNLDDMAIGPAVTLPNHSADSSGFVAYARIKQCGIIKPSTKPLQTSNAIRLSKEFFRSGEEENLLTSERTHFRPIENFVDGHTFEINDALDTVDFERSDSGLLVYESEQYLEYTRNDIYMADEEVSTSSTNLLKYGSKANVDKSDVFIIKFRVRRSEEMACQTEEHDFQLAAAKMAESPISPTTVSRSFHFPQVAVNNIFHNTLSVSRQANNEAIMAAVTKAVAAAAKAAAENHLNAGHFSWLHTTHPSTAGTSSSSTVENNPNWLATDASVCDEVDFCKANTLNNNAPHRLNYVSSIETIDVSERQQQQQLAQNWSMQEVEKQCHQRRCLPHELKNKFPTSVDIERTEENSLDNTSSLHTLWGMCAACNSCEYGKSMPANRLLRDELQLEADEIMSDLRYMQDLYIGESADIPSEANENNEEGEEAEVENSNDKMMMNSNIYQKKNSSSKYMKNPWNAVDNSSVQVSMLQKVNQLIEDLLKPDNAVVKLPPKESEHFDKNIKATELSNVLDMQDKGKNLWQYGEHNVNNNIWQQKPISEEVYEGKATVKMETETLNKPMKLLKQVGGSLTEDPLYMEKLNWEHENLAKIWQETPNVASTQTETKIAFEEEQHNEMTEKFIQENMQKQEEFLKENEKVVEEKNQRNLQGNATTAAVSSCDNYKRVQHFFNNNAAKLKLAANRKRRHSASQNFYQQQQQYGINNGNNNNNDNITDLNINQPKLNEQHYAEEQHHQQPLLQKYEVVPFSKIAIKNNNLDDQPKKQTIITCKYWTTATNGTQTSLDSAAAAMMLLAAATKVNTNADDNNIYDDPDDVMLEENFFGNATFSCLIDKNASILKHMTMMTRPLTR